MTLQQRLRESAEAWVNEVDTRKEAADAIDALAARIKELEGALRKLADNKLSDENCSSVELAGRRVAYIAREALK